MENVDKSTYYVIILRREIVAGFILEVLYIQNTIFFCYQRIHFKQCTENQVQNSFQTMLKGVTEVVSF